VAEPTATTSNTTNNTQLTEIELGILQALLSLL
jgi:hypothetical protein